MINNRQAGRRRGRGSNNGGGGGGNGPRQGGGGGRGDSGNRIDSRARGNASQLLEKYKNLASDAQRQGDRINTEYYLQFADHYFRVLADQRGRFEDQQPRRPQADFDADGEDYGDEGEPIRGGEQGEGRPAYGERQPRDRTEQQGDRPNERQSERQNDRQNERQPREYRGDRPRRWERDDRPRGGEGEIAAEVEVAGQRRADPPLAGEDLEARAEAVLEADAPLADPAPRRRGRPRREPAAVEPSAAQASEPAGDHGMDADRLPPALGIAAANDADGTDEEAPKPRRRRVRSAGPADA